MPLPEPLNGIGQKKFSLGMAYGSRGFGLCSLFIFRLGLFYWNLCPHLSVAERHNTQHTKQHTMNKVINLPRRHSWEYRYEVQGCIFTIEKTMSGAWVMYGYASLQDEQECNYFEELVDSKKKYMTHFLKFTFERGQYI